MKNPPTIVRYRLYPRDPVKEGEWYLTVLCKKCSKLIYAVRDESKGQVLRNFANDAEIVVPCPRCRHDDLYTLEDIQSLVATESLDGFRPVQVPISKAPRKPLLPQFQGVEPIMGVGLIEDRPKAAAIVGRIVTAWSDIEVQCARLLAQIMGTNVAAAAAVFSSLRSSRAQADALEAAARAVLSAPDRRLFSAHMARKAALEKERNDLAHGCFGVSVSLPDDIIWVSQADYITFTTAHRHGTDPESLKAYRKRMFVYELGTLERIAQEIAAFHAQLGALTGYLGSTDTVWRNQRYERLAEQHHIRAEMKKLR